MSERETTIEQFAKRRLGTVLRGKYRLDRLLGVGGMAVVYKATHRNQAEFALKMLHPELSIREDVRVRFLREGYAANSVKHPGAVLVVDDDVAEDGAAFLVMELLEGEGVEALWERRGLHLPPSEAAAIVSQLLDVLAAAHPKGIVHRDIKPANLFVTREGVVKVLDFGIARAKDAAASGANSPGVTGTGMLLGTPAFMPPEQALAKSSEMDGQTDVWAAGATLFTLISGHYVHEGDNAAQLMIRAATAPARPIASVAPGLPPAIAHVIDRALAFEKSARWPSAVAMRDALDAASRASFGMETSKGLLVSALSSRDPALAATATPPPFMPQVAPPSAPIASGNAMPPAAPASRIAGAATTAQPVSDSARSVPPSPRSVKSLVAALAGVIALVAVGGGIVWQRSSAHGAAAAGLVAPLDAVSAAPPPIVTPPPPSASAPPAAAPLPVRVTPPPAPAATTSSAAPSRPKSHPTPPASAPAPPAATAQPSAAPTPPKPAPPPAPAGNPLDIGIK